MVDDDVDDDVELGGEEEAEDVTVVAGDVAVDDGTAVTAAKSSISAPLLLVPWYVGRALALSQVPTA